MSTPFRIGGFSLSPEGRAFVLRETKSRRVQFAGFALLSLVAAVIEMTGIGLVFPLLIIIVDPQSLEKVPLLADVIDRLGIGRGTTLSIVLIVLIGVIMVSKNAYMLLFSWIEKRTLARWKTELSRRLIRMYLFSDYTVYLAKSSSEIIRNMSLISLVFDQFIAAMITLVVNALILAGLCVLLVFILPSETLLSLLLIAAVTWALYAIMRKPFKEIGEELNVLFERRQSILRQSIGMIKETKLNAKENFFLDAYVDIERRNFSRQARYNFMATIPPLVTEGAIIVAILAIITYILYVSGQQQMGLAILGLLAATLFRLTPVINRALTSLQLMNLGRNSVDILAREFNELEAQVYRPETEPPPLPFISVIRLKAVSYSYPNAAVRAVREVTLDIRRGEMIGITGPSGAGKSTLVALLMGLLPPATGRIAVDEAALDTPGRLRAWQRHISFVPQGVFLIEDTVARNVAFGVAPDLIDEMRVWKALEVAQLREFVAGLPNGIHEFLGEDGARLSGGQRQRLAIARALYEDTEILVFDEATSALDAANEQAFRESLMRVRRDRTVIMIAHRLSTLRDCDRIVMLDRGSVLDVGPFDDLYDRCPSFRRLVELSRLPPAAEEVQSG